MARKQLQVARRFNRYSQLAAGLAVVAAGLFGCASKAIEVCVDRGMEEYTPEVMEAALQWADAGAQVSFGCPGDVLVRFGPIEQDDSGKRVVGSTHVPRSGRTTVVLDNEKEWSSDSLKRIVLHELGHVLGIEEHVDDPEAVMFDSPTADDLSKADRQALCSALDGACAG